MNIHAKLIQLLPVQSGTGKNGPWKKQDIILEIPGQYPKKLCVSVWGDKIDVGSYKVGDSLNVYFDVESREFNGKWYTDIKAWKIESVAGNTEPAPIDDVPLPAEPEDELPF